MAPNQEWKIYKLIKSLYRLKQAPNQWSQKFDKKRVFNSFKINECDNCVCWLKQVPKQCYQKFGKWWNSSFSISLRWEYTWIAGVSPKVFTSYSTLMYITNFNWPDITYAMNKLSRFNFNQIFEYISIINSRVDDRSIFEISNPISDE